VNRPFVVNPGDVKTQVPNVLNAAAVTGVLVPGNLGNKVEEEGNKVEEEGNKVEEEGNKVEEEVGVARVEAKAAEAVPEVIHNRPTEQGQIFKEAFKC